jgi:hypothetical protein
MCQHKQAIEALKSEEKEKESNGGMVLNEKGLSLGAGRLWGLSTIKTGATFGTCVAPLWVRPST